MALRAAEARGCCACLGWLRTLHSAAASQQRTGRFACGFLNLGLRSPCRHTVTQLEELGCREAMRVLIQELQRAIISRLRRETVSKTLRRLRSHNLPGSNHASGLRSNWITSITSDYDLIRAYRVYRVISVIINCYQTLCEKSWKFPKSLRLLDRKQGLWDRAAESRSVLPVGIGRRKSYEYLGWIK